MCWTRTLAVATTALTLASTALADVVFKVNGVEATPGQLAIARYKVTDDAPSLAGDEAAVTRAAKDLLIADILLAEAAREAGLAVTERELKKGIVALQAKLGGKAAFADQLKALGASQEDLEELAGRRRLAERYVDTAVAPGVAVTEEEARAHYEIPENQVYHAEQLRLRAIFVNAPPGIGEKEEAKARARIDEAERRVLAGEEFAAVAREVSDDMSKAAGGDFGWVAAEVIPAQFLGRVWAIEAGEMSGVLRGEYSYALIQVLEKRPRGPYGFDEMKEDVTARLRKEKLDA
ncbi:MAG: peptidyl-prolyl cis-trans isomerase, partial [Acidobacteriota bacterium]|nr:peptidyl-prolyl cis-trans isomerase [Acidobacteriota bacterium]